MAERYNTNNPRPSNSMKDLNDNALAYDDFINSDDDTAVDRFNNPFPTVRKQVNVRIDELVGASQNAIESAAIAKAAAQSATIAANVYLTVAEAQQAIDDGLIPLGALFNVVSQDFFAFVDQYQNVDDVATSTGKSYPSSDFVQLVANTVSTLFTQYAPAGWKVTFPDDNLDFSVGIDNSGRLVSGSHKTIKSEIDSAAITNAEIGTTVSQLVSTEMVNIGESSININVDDDALSLRDVLGRISVLLTSAGVFKAGKSEVNHLSALVNLSLPDSSAFSAMKVPGFAWAFVDEQENICAGVRKNGTWSVGRMTANGANIKNIASVSVTADSIDVRAIKSPSFLRYFSQEIMFRMPDIAHKIGYGQSLAAGVNTQKLLTTAPVYNALRFVGGVRPQDATGTPAQAHASLVPYIETYALTNNGGAWETPMGGSIKG